MPTCPAGGQVGANEADIAQHRVGQVGLQNEGIAHFGAGHIGALGAGRTQFGIAIVGGDLPKLPILARSEHHAAAQIGFDKDGVVHAGATQAGTAQVGAAEFRRVGELIVATLDGLAEHGESGNAATEAQVREGVAELTRRFPIY